MINVATASRVISESNKNLAAAKAELAVPEDSKPVIRVSDTVTIIPQDLNVEVPAVPAHMLIMKICRILVTYARFQRSEDVVTLAMWIASTWFVEPTSEQGMINGMLMFEAHLRVLLIGVPESGKNRVMKIMRRLVRNPSIIGTGKVTAVGVRNLLNHGKTVFIDEFHKRVGTTGRRNFDLQEDILAYSREAGSIDGLNGEDNERDMFGPIVLAAQPSILKGMQGDALKDLFQRCLIITLHPADDVVPGSDAQFERDCADTRTALELWGAGLYQQMRGQESMKYAAIHSMPRNFKGRRLECADVLCAVADRAVNPVKVAAGDQDTEWAKITRDAAQLLLYGRGNVEEVAANLAAEFDPDASVQDALNSLVK